jgi:hypothetical protein
MHALINKPSKHNYFVYELCCVVLPYSAKIPLRLKICRFKLRLSLVLLMLSQYEVNIFIFRPRMVASLSKGLHMDQHPVSVKTVEREFGLWTRVVK